MRNFYNRLKKGIIISDGALGTMLQASGLDSGVAPEEWVLKEPEKILKVHQEYIKAGSEMIETCTFGANYLKLKALGLEGKIKEINYQAVELARQAAGERLVAGSVGPTGKMMQPYGDLSFADAINTFQEQISILVEAGIDVVCLETMSDLKEMRAAVIAAKSYDVPVIAQMTFTDRGTTLTGSSPEVVAIVLTALGVDVIGVNCVAGIDNALAIIKKMKPVTYKSLSVHANAGLPITEGGKVIYPQSPEEFVDGVNDLLEKGVKIIGACCGTTPEYISKVKEKVVSFPQEKVKKSSLKYHYLASTRKIIKFNKDSFMVDLDFSEDGLKKALIKGNWGYISQQASLLMALECEILNLKFPYLDFTSEQVASLVRELELSLNIPLAFSVTKAKIIEGALKEYTGKALLQYSGREKQERNKLIKLAKKYGAYFYN